MTPNFIDIAAWSQQYFEVGAFYALALLVLPFAFGALLDKNIIRAGFILIAVFGGIAGISTLLQAQFLAMAQVMIYAVGITLVVVIALMLTNPKMEQEGSTAVSEQQVPAIIISLLVFATTYLALRSELWPVVSPLTETPADNILTIGVALLRDYALPFEFASILLLVVLMGAVMLAKHEPSTKKTNSEITEGKDNVVKV